MLKRQILLRDSHHRQDYDHDHHHHDCDHQLTDDLDLLLFTNASNNSNLLELVEEPVERWEEVVFVPEQRFFSNKIIRIWIIINLDLMAAVLAFVISLII